MEIKRGILGRKAQLTAFILIGIVILAIFGFVLFTSGEIKKSEMEKEIDIAAEKITETNILKNYVTLCLKDSLQQGLVMAGRQGGVLYEPSEYYEYEGYKVIYGIKKQEWAPEIPGPPSYPCIDKPGTPSYQCGAQNYIMNPKKVYPFGAKNLPFLCDINGPNAAYLKLFPFPCPPGTYGPGSIQEHLNLFIEINLPKCVNLTPIEEVTGLKITNSTPNVTVAFGENDITATATYPLNISLEGYGSMRFFDFQINIPVRFKKIFGMADFVAKNEMFDIEFNASKDSSKYRYFGKPVTPPMNVTTYCPGCLSGDYTNIIEINDIASIIEGKPYVFRFAVRNRIPALDPVQDIGVTAGDTIAVEPKAYDPDDGDELSYRIDGWKQGEWTFSGQYYAYTTQLDDAGDYTITVYACDYSGECDWQDVSIHVEPVQV